MRRKRVSHCLPVMTRAGGYGERNQDKAQPPIAKAVLDLFDGVCTEAASHLKQVTHNQCKGDQAGNKNQRLPDEAYLSDCVHAKSSSSFSGRDRHNKCATCSPYPLNMTVSCFVAENKL